VDREAIRSDESAKHDQLIRHSVVQVLDRRITKRKNSSGDNEIWTAPVVLTIPERTTGWNAEEVLRKSKVFPTFHAGPRSFLNQ
jgi:hypothetical protein